MNEVLNDNEQNLRQDIYNFARILNLVIHYELENYDFIEYIIKSLSRYLSKQERKQDMEFLFVRTIRKLAKNPTQMEKNQLFESMKKQMKVLLEDKHERVVLEYFDLFSWVESKINRTTYAEEVRKRLL